MKVSENGSVSIPPKLGKKHGLGPGAQVVLVDQPEGILLKAARRSGSRGIVASLLEGGPIPGRTEDWLRMTRGGER